MLSAILKILTIISLIHQISAVEKLEKSFPIIIEKDYFHEFDYSDGRLFYLACPRGYLSRKVCWVVGEKSAGEEDVFSCQVTLKTYHEKDEEIGPLVLIKSRFDNDKVVLFWQVEDSDSDEEYSMISYLQLETCKITDIRLNVNVDPEYVFVNSYVNTFDVFFLHNRKSSNSIDRITIDHNGKLIKGPVPFIEDPDEPQHLLALSKSTPDKGFFYLEIRNESETFHSLINSDGTEKQLAHIYQAPIYKRESTRNGFATACAIYSKHTGYINCTQYDVTGKLKFDLRLKVDDSARLHLVHNIHRGGILLGYSETIKCENCENNGVVYSYLVKCNSHGIIVGTRIEENADEQWQTIFENDSGDYCLLKSSPIFQSDEFADTISPQDLDITHECYNDNDFTK